MKRLRKTINKAQLTEHKIQVNAFDEIRLRARHDWRYDLIYAIPNSGKRHIAVAVKMKLEGQKAGAWDITCDFPAGGWCGMKIETKVPGNGLTPLQVFMGKLYIKAGWFVRICYSRDEIIQTCADYLDGKIKRKEINPDLPDLDIGIASAA